MKRKCNPDNYFAQVNFGLDELERGHRDSARTHLNRAREIEPRLALATANLMHVYWMDKDLASIRGEGEPLVSDPEFMAFNQHEPQALALLNRMVARERDAMLDVEGARELYQRARAYDPTDLDLQNEFKLFNESHR